MNNRIKKFLVIGGLLSIVTSGVVYAFKPINTITDVAVQGDTLTSNWVNAVNNKLNTVNAGGSSDWQCNNSFVSNSTSGDFRFLASCINPNCGTSCHQNNINLQYNNGEFVRGIKSSSSENGTRTCIGNVLISGNRNAKVYENSIPMCVN